MADNRSKSMNCKKSMKQNRNPTRLRILPFILLSSQQRSKATKYSVGLAKTIEPQIRPENGTLYGRGLFSLFPLPIVPRALPFFFSLSISTTHRGLCGGESCVPIATLNQNKRTRLLYLGHAQTIMQCFVLH